MGIILIFCITMSSQAPLPFASLNHQESIDSDESDDTDDKINHLFSKSHDSHDEYEDLGSDSSSESTRGKKIVVVSNIAYNNA